MMANTASPSWTSPRCGLFIGDDARTVPLTSVQVEASIAGRCARVTLTQRYQGLEDSAVEAVYTFPLDEGAAVCGFEALIGQRRIKGVLDDKARAFDAYDDALAEGRLAALLEQKRPNVFTVSVGHLRPGDEVEVRLSYVSLLPQQGPGVRFVVPTTIAPRSGLRGAGGGEREASGEVLQEVPYRLSLDVHVSTDPPLRVIESPSHPLRVIVGPRATTVSVSSDELAMDRDFVLYLETVEAHAPKVRVARDAEGVAVLMVTFYPDPDSLPSDGEQYHFIVDASGSARGDAFVQARQAALAFIEALVIGDHFNIHALGGAPLWPEPMPADEAHRQSARRFVRALSPAGDKDLGAALRSLKQGLGGGARQIVIITDGAVEDEASLIALCQGLGAWARVFPVGVGAAPDSWLLRRMAAVGGGVAEVVHPGERIAPAVWRTMARAGAPVLQHVHLDWEGLDVEQAPAMCPPVFGGDSLTVFGRVRGGLHGSVTLQADGRSWRVPVNLAAAEPGGPIPLFWAREALRAMESRLERPGGSLQGRQQQRLDAMIALSKRTGLLCSATSYVAVEDTAPPRPSPRSCAPSPSRWPPTSSPTPSPNPGGPITPSETPSSASRSPQRPPPLCRPDPRPPRQRHLRAATPSTSPPSRPLWTRAPSTTSSRRARTGPRPPTRRRPPSTRATPKGVEMPSNRVRASPCPPFAAPEHSSPPRSTPSRPSQSPGGPPRTTRT